MVRELEGGGFTVTWDRVERRADFRAALARGGWDVILSDYALPELDALSALRDHREQAPAVPFIVVSETNGEERVVAAVKQGAQDFLPRRCLSRLAAVVERALRE